MSAQRFAGIIGALALVAGLIALFAGVSVPVERGAGSISCGSAVAADYGKARTEDSGNELRRTLVGGERLSPDSNYAADCASAVSSRRVWSIPLAAVGAIALAGALLIRPRASR